VVFNEDKKEEERDRRRERVRPFYSVRRYGIFVSVTQKCLHLILPRTHGRLRSWARKGPGFVSLIGGAVSMSGPAGTKCGVSGRKRVPQTPVAYLELARVADQ
jgi:hypothetical protein